MMVDQREPGWYWVRYTRHSDQLAGWQIGPRIYPPGEDRERDELLAALRELADEHIHSLTLSQKRARAALAKAAAFGKTIIKSLY